MSYEIVLSYRSARATLVIWEDEETISLTTVAADLKRRGHATAVMKRVCNIADGLRMELILSVEPFGDEPRMTEEQLKVFYAKFGFTETAPNVMQRPNPKVESD